MLRSSLVLVLALGSVSAAAPQRKARWYVNSDVASNVAFAQAHPGALTGWYGCCGLLGIDGAGKATQLKNISALAGPMKAALLPSTGRELTFHAVFSVAESAIHSGAAKGGAATLARLAAAGGADGVLCDYEPSDNYTDAHAQAYADFLGALAGAAHALSPRLEVGIDVAGWGILDHFSILQRADVDFYTSMTPTYDAPAVPGADRRFTTELIGAVGAARAAIGVGSVAAPGFEASCSNMPAYGWNASSFGEFASWLRTSAGVLDLDVWRCDIDHYGKTAGWFVDTVVRFLGLPAGL